MASCLGLYIESNVIKYAKVSKERETLKIESFGMKFYDKLGDAIKQIVSETFSYKVPISVNLSEEMYNYFYMFNLLKKEDLKKAIDTEFESYCFDRNLNKNAFESRYALVNSIEDKDKIKVLHVSTNKTTISKATQIMEDNKISTIAPIGTTIANIATVKPKENVIIVNIENKTTITTIVNQKVYSVDKFEEGAEEILEKINEKENSFAKAYEICKNSTIYTMEGKELQDEENEYLDDIMPTLYKIVTKLQDYVTNTTIKFDTIYITGTMSVVNNIDLYFQEFFSTEKCEMLKPYFVTENIKINIKDYIEVNSAIALALQGLGYGIKAMNFKALSLSDRLPDWMKIEIGPGSKDGKSSKFNFDLSFSDLKGKMDATERWMMRAAGGVLILTLIYSGFSIYLDEQISKKTLEVEDVNLDTRKQIALVEADTNSVKQKTNRYIELKDNLVNINKQAENNAKTKNVIPNLLVNIMSVIPKDVQLTEIENTTGAHIVIRAESKYYEQLGYFKAKIKEDDILENVISSQGEKQDEFVKVVIEGGFAMKKIVIAVLIVLLVVLAYFTMFQGLSIGTINILSVNQIIKSKDELTNKIAETNSLLKRDYPSKKEALLSEVSNLLDNKEAYFNVAKKSTESEITKANTEETYLIEYLWVRVGRHSRFKGVNVKMDFSSANTGEQDAQNLAFTVTGQYVGIIEFIYALEDDSELNFKIEDFKMAPNQGENGANLVATFNVRNVRISTENVTATVKTESKPTDENTNTQPTTETQVDENKNTNTNDSTTNEQINYNDIIS